MNINSTKNSIISLVKIIYPLANPIVEIEAPSRGKYKCIVYMNSFSVPTRPLFYSNICNSVKIAINQVLALMEPEIKEKMSYEEIKATNFLLFAKAEIQKLNNAVASAKRDENNLKLALRRLQYLKK